MIEEVKMPKFEREVEIDAPVEKVWEVMVNPNFWSQWLPGIDSITNATQTEEGPSFEYTNEAGSGHGTVVKMEPNKRLEIITQTGKDKDKHAFELKASGGFLGLSADECKVNYTLDTLMGGGILGNFVAGGNPKDAIRVKKAMMLLRKLVESQ